MTCNDAPARRFTTFGGQRRTAVGFVVASLAGLTLAACGSAEDSSDDDGDSSGTPSSDVFVEGMVTDDTADGDPKPGGVLNFAVASEATSLDPADGNGLNGAFGGTELAAIYDVLMRFDSTTGTYEPQLAESLEPDDDLTTWTLTLRDGVTFSDGTPLDSAAVKASIERHVAEGGLHDELIDRVVEFIETPDPLTVVFQLSSGWSGFPFLLAEAPGAIVSPTAVATFGENLDVNPAGAGPFTLERFAPGEEISMTANPDYWGGAPLLEGVRFVPMDDGQARIDSLNGGEVDAAVLDDPLDIREARAEDYAGYMTIFAMGGIVSINHTEPHPGADLTVRQAIDFAIDPEVIDERAYDGNGMPGKEMYQESSPWHTDEEPNPYDLDQAKEALETAKANGFDGELQMLYLASREDEALTVEAMLEAAGFTITPVKSASVNDFIQAYFVDREWDITISGLGAEPTISPYVGLTAFLAQEGNYIDYSNPEMNALLEELGAAGSQEDALEVMAEVQRLWNEDIPVVVTYAQPKYVPWQQDVHGVVPTLQASVLLHEAWLDR